MGRQCILGVIVAGMPAGGVVHPTDHYKIQDKVIKMNETEVTTKTRKQRRFLTPIAIITAFCVLGSTARAFAGDADSMDWFIPWNADGCWRLVLISMPVVIIIGYIS